METRQDIQGEVQGLKSWPKVAIIVLNWNGWRDTLECLDSLMANTWTQMEIIVVDNGSTDDSVAQICSWASARGIPLHMQRTTEKAEVDWELPSNPSVAASDNPRPLKQLVLIENRENLGFARGNNVGIRWALQGGAKYICILNNDTIVPGDFVEKAIRSLEASGAALLGPKILDACGKDWQWPVRKRFGLLGWLLIFSVARRLVKRWWVYRRYFYVGDKLASVYAIPGSCMFFDARVLREIGFFDERTFLFWEEFIVAERLAAHRYETVYDPRICIVHKWHRSVDRIGPIKFLANWESEIYFFTRYRRWGVGMLILEKAYRLCVFAWRLLAERDYRRANVMGRVMQILVSKWS